MVSALLSRSDAALPKYSRIDLSFGGPHRPVRRYSEPDSVFHRSPSQRYCRTRMSALLPPQSFLLRHRSLTSVNSPDYILPVSFLECVCEVYVCVCLCTYVHSLWWLPACTDLFCIFRTARSEPEIFLSAIPQYYRWISFALPESIAFIIDVLQASWHPLSSEHLVLLSSDGVLRSRFP